MIRRHRFKVRTWITLAAIAGGGLLPGTCMIRTREALVQGSKSFLANVLLNPQNIADLPFDEAADNLADGG
ncbi:MAG: hypothetical protein ACYSUI_08700 [Planctomycetota bacterium]